MRGARGVRCISIFFFFLFFFLFFWEEVRGWRGNPYASRRVSIDCLIVYGRNLFSRSRQMVNALCSAL